MKEAEEQTEALHAYFSAVLRLRQDLRQRVQRTLTELGYADISMEVTQVLYYIHFIAEGQKSNQQDIANRTGTNKSTVTSLIDNLVKRKLLLREVDPKNRRSNIITLTAEGVAFVQEVYDKVYQDFDMQHLGVTVSEINKMTQLMEQFMQQGQEINKV